MSETTAEYEFTSGGWRWIYQLYQDKLVTFAVRGEERQHFEFALRHADTVPDFLFEDNGGLLKIRPVLIATACIVAGTTLLFGGLFLGAVIMGEPNAGTFLFLCLPAIFTELLLIFLVCRSVGFRQYRRWALFKRVSDGGELFQMSSEDNPRDDRFEQFVEKIVSAIAAQNANQKAAKSSDDAFTLRNGH
jgi:hypothetical protein